MHTYYEILGVPKDADEAMVKAAYRKLSRTAHPDLGGNAALFTMVQEAYDTLKDEGRRQAYDASLAAPSATVPPSGTPRSSRPQASSAADARARARADYNARFQGSSGASPSTAAPGSLGSYLKSAKGRFHWILIGVFVGLLPFLSILADRLVRPLGLSLYAESIDFPDRLSGYVSWFVPMFVIGLVLAPLWLARHHWRPFPAWEQVVVCVALAVGIGPMTGSFTSFLVGLGVIGAYLVAVRFLRDPSRRAARPRRPSRKRGRVPARRG